MEIKRVIDLIAELEKHDPVAPVEVWSGEFGVDHGRHAAAAVFQVTPIMLRAMGLEHDPREEHGALPVVVRVE